MTSLSGLSMIKGIVVQDINGGAHLVDANRFTPWKFIKESTENDPAIVAYMCALEVCDEITHMLRTSIEISENEYKRLMEKLKVYSANPLCMFDGFEDYSEPEGGTTDGQDPVQKH